MTADNGRSACPRLEQCALHRQYNTTALIDTFVALYCEADFSRCERYRLLQLEGTVPDTLLPNGRFAKSER